MLKRGEFIADKVNDAIRRGLIVDENLLAQINIESQRSVNDSYDKSGNITDMRIIEYRKNRINTFRELSKPVQLGFKDESYYSESELIRGYVSPTYNQLSEDEKKIWCKN